MDDLDYFRFLLALLLVVGLIGLFAFLLKRLGLGSIRAPTLGKRHRLSIQEVATIDARHKLVLVRRDDRDHEGHERRRRRRADDRDAGPRLRGGARRGLQPICNGRVRVPHGTGSRIGARLGKHTLYRPRGRSRHDRDAPRSGSTLALVLLFSVY